MKSEHRRWKRSIVLLIVGLATAYGGTARAALTDGLISYWGLDEPAGTTAVDLFGGKNGTAIGGVTVAVPGKVGTAFQFDGTSGWLDVGSVGISGNAPRTIAGWFKSDNLDHPDWTGIFGFMPNQSGTGRFFDIQVRNGNKFGHHQYGWERDLMAEDVGVWHFAAATHDGTTTAWYGDGVLFGSEGRSPGTVDEFKMAKRGDNNNYFGGTIDEVAVWDRALSASEITALYNGGDGMSFGTDGDVVSAGIGLWNTAATWTPPMVPTFRTKVTVDDDGAGTPDVVTLQTGNPAGEAFSLNIVNGGSVIVEANQTLSVFTKLQGSGTVSLGNGAVLNASGNIGTVNIAGPSTLDTRSGTLTVGSLSGAGRTLVKTGAGRVLAEAAGLDGSTVELGGGTMAFQGPVAYFPGLWYGEVGGDINTSAPNPHTKVTVDLAETEDGIGGTTTEIYTGQIFDLDGHISFTEDIDDRTRLYIDQTEVITSDNWQDRVSTVDLALTPNTWHDFELRISNGGGGSGPHTAPGIGYDADGADPPTWVHPADPGNGSLFRHEDYLAINMTGTDFVVNADSTLELVTRENASFGDLTLLPDVALTIRGGDVSFQSTTLSGAGDATYTFDVDGDTLLTAAGTTGLNTDRRTVRIVKTGPGRVTLNKKGLNLNFTTFDIQEGELAALIGIGTGGRYSAVSRAKFELNGGGLVISSAGGTRAFNENLPVTADSQMIVGQIPGGAAGQTIKLFTSSTRGAALSNGAVLSLEARDGYTLDVGGRLSGDGGIRGAGGTVNINPGLRIYTGVTAASGGVMNINTPITTTSNVEVTGGTMELNADLTTVGSPTVWGEVLYTRYDGATQMANLTELDNGALDGGNGGLLSLTPDESTPWTGQLYQGDLGSNYTVMFNGIFRPNSTGNYEFWVHGDDHEILWIDLNRNGEFDGPEERVTQNLRPEGWNIPKVNTVALEGGQDYAFALAGVEYGGGAWVEMSIDPGTGRVRVDPAAGTGGQWGHKAASDTLVDTGTLNVNAGVTLTTDRVAIRNSGTVNVRAGATLNTGHVAVTSGAHFNTEVPVSLETLTLKGGTANTGTNRITINRRLTAPYLTLTSDSGSFQVSGPDLAAEVTVLDLAGSTIQVEGSRDLVAHWTFDETGGNTAANSVDPTHNGTLITLPGDATSWVPGQVGGALRFDGLGYVDVPDGFSNFLGGITIAAWVNTETFTNWARVVDFGNGAGNDNFLLARRDVSNNLRFEIHDGYGGVADQTLDPDNVFLTGQWQHLVATIDADNNAVVYLDGVEIGSQKLNLPDDVLRRNNYIGESNWGNDDFFQGLMDDLYIWNRGLSAAEAQAVYQAGLAGKEAPDFIPVLPTLSGLVTGNGTLVGEMAVAGKITPGGGAVGTITVDGNLTMNAGATYEAELGAGGASDFIDVTGTLTLPDGTAGPLTIVLKTDGTLPQQSGLRFDLFGYGHLAGDEPLVEDVNGDGVVNDDDLNLVLSALGTSAFDLDGLGDGVGTTDVEALLAVLGDRSGEGDIDPSIIHIVTDTPWTWTSTGTVRHAGGKIFLDGVDTTPAGGLAAAVPEPGSLLLLVLGALGLVPRLRRRRKA